MVMRLHIRYSKKYLQMKKKQRENKLGMWQGNLTDQKIGERKLIDLYKLISDS